VITIFGTTYFTIGAGLIVLALAAPLLLWFSVWLLRPNIEGKPRSTRWLAVGGTTLALLLLTAVGLYWDVYLIGQRAKELCAETGIVVYRQAVTPGFIGSAAIEKWGKHGFRFVETEYFGKKYQHVMSEKGSRKFPINEFQSRYLAHLVDHPLGGSASPVDRRFRQLGAAVADIETGEMLGKLTKYSIDYGWIDRLAISLSGFTSVPHTCGKTETGKIVFSDIGLGFSDLVSATLSPD